MLKKIFSAVMLLTLIIFATPAQAQESFDLNRDFNSQLVPTSYIYGGRVVGIKTYLSVREQPTVHSREIMRLPPGAKLTLRFTGNQDWWWVVEYNGMWEIGYVSAKYISIR